MNQMEIINEFLRQANDQYKACKTIDDVRDLRENVRLIDRYIASGKQSFMSAQKEYNILYNKITKTIREYEGGTTIYNETGGFYDFGQELD
jgi:DNA anti-recombination protein RmuC